MRKPHFVSRALASFLLLLTAATGFAQTGVSDNRVSLPEGSGGVGGFADNAQVSGSQGSMSFSVPMNVPNGTGSVTPSLDLSYNSNSGNGLAGMGWGFGLGSIERSSSKGLAQYTIDDRFVENGANELIYVGGTDQYREYRARYEGSFNRYRWHNSGQGAEGYWTVESAGGIIAYYGADADGTLAPQARMGQSRTGTFKYHLREVVDAFGNVARYAYEPSDEQADGSTRLISRIDYTFNRQGESPRHSIFFNYEARSDVMSDCKAGYCELLAKRLKSVRMTADGVEMRRYELLYEELTAQADLSRLKELRRYGAQDELFPGRYTFEYQRSLGMDCMSGACAEPYFVTVANSVGADLRVGSATLIDINGDALPDVVNTQNEEHLFYINELALDGSQSFTSAGRSALPQASEFNLSRRRVQTLDVNGDGFTDIVDYANQVYLKNLGQGDWDSTQALVAGAGYPQDSVFEDSGSSDGGQLDNLRFFDYDNDKLIDLLYITQASTQIYRTLPNGGTESVDGVDQVSADFGGGFEVGVQLTDVNGDGLQDLVKVEPGEFIYRLYLGYGRWTESTRVQIAAVTQDLVPSVEFEDMNGDGLTDLVVVYDGELQYSLNQNGRAFSEWTTINTVNGRALPNVSESTVLYADMNGNGSVDVVWFGNNGEASYLELFPERPNLLSEISNNLGKVTRITYDSSVRERLRAEQANLPWTYTLPHSATLVVEKEIYDALNDVSEVLSYRYRDGYYDGAQKQFRGYRQAETESRANAFQEVGIDVRTFDLGIEDHYYNGLLTSKASYRLDESDERVLLTQTNTTYGECEVQGIPEALSSDIRFVCATQSDIFIVEGMPTAQAKMSKTFEYDGYGNVIKTSDLGVVSMGGQACAECANTADLFGAPCGADCRGDEAYAEQTFATPGPSLGQWRHDLIVQTSDYADPSSPNMRTQEYYYDGDAFVGLPAGEYTEGRLHRLSASVTATDTINTKRHRYDDWGNIVQVLEPLDSVGATSGFIRVFDEFGQFMTSDLRFHEDELGNTYSTVSEMVPNTTWATPKSIVAAIVRRGDETIVGGELLEYEYDNFGRIKSLFYPSSEQSGLRDASDKPSVTYSYTYDNPITELVAQHRTDTDGSLDRTHVKCVDGFGRLFQERVSIGDGQFQVSGFIRRNPRGNIVEHYKPFLADSASCDRSPPRDNVLKLTTRYDALSRVKEVILPDEDVFGGVASTRRVRYEPLKTIFYDEKDTEEGGLAVDTPNVQYTDGQARLYRLERFLAPGGEPITHEVFYDDYSNLKGYTDPNGNQRLQIYDRLGRLLRVSDPDFGLESYTYDDNGNLITSTDARGRTQVFEYDLAGRLARRYEQGARDTTLSEYYYDFPRECPASKCTSTGGELVEVKTALGELGISKRWFGFNGRHTPVYMGRHIGSAEFELKTEVNNLGQVIAETFPGNQRIEYRYRGDGKLLSVPNYVERITYDEKGQTQSLTYSNGVIENYTFDARDHLVGVNAVDGIGNQFIDLGLEFDRRGNVVAISDSLSEGPLGHIAQYEYDALYRLTSAQLGTDTDTESITYAYDRIDNLVSKRSSDPTSPAHVGDYQYGDTQPHAAISAGDTNYLYDESGQMVSRGTHAYTWDYRGLLTEIYTEDGELIGRNVYGEDGKRAVREENGSVTFYVTSKYEVRDGQGVIYVNLGAQRQAIKIEQDVRVDGLSDLAPFNVNEGMLVPDGDSFITAGDAWASQLITSEQLATGDDATTSSVVSLLNASARRLLSLEAEPQDRVTYYHYDHNHNNIAITNAAGEVEHENSYYPFLALKASSGGAAEDRRVANGKETDELTGLTNYGARYADLKLGRFISPDRYFDVVGANDVFDAPQEATGAYIFTNNNPTSSVDVDGRWVSNIIGAVAGTIVEGVKEYRSYKASGDKSWKAIRGHVGSVLVFGTGVGFLTSGVSAIGGTVGLAATEGKRLYNKKYNTQWSAAKQESNAKLFGAGVGFVAGLATMGTFIGTDAVKAINDAGGLGAGAVAAIAHGVNAATHVGIHAANTVVGVAIPSVLNTRAVYKLNKLRKKNAEHNVKVITGTARAIAKFRKAARKHPGKRTIKKRRNAIKTTRMGKTNRRKTRRKAIRSK